MGCSFLWTLEASHYDRRSREAVGVHGQRFKVETPINDNIRELVTWECKEHWSEIMNVLANPKGSVGRWNLTF
jgi:hypothetical protein